MSTLIIIIDKEIMNPDASSWVNHINRNALYNLREPKFIELIKKSNNINLNVKGFLNAIDVSLWMNSVSNCMNDWEEYKKYAHKFQYTDLIQSYGDAVSSEQIAQILVENLNTHLIHGIRGSSQQSTGVSVS